MTGIYRSEEGKQAILARYREILASWPVPNRQYEVETGFGSTFVIESGPAELPPLILLHGSVANSFTWYGDVITLIRTHHVYAVDLIGEAGLSAESRPEYESGAYAQWLHELLQGLGLRTCSMAGLSLGGWMALDFATAYPEKVEALVLFCPGGLVRQKASFLWKAVFFSLCGKWGEEQIFKLLNGGKATAESVPGLDQAFAFMALINRHFRPRMAALPVFSGERLSRLTMPVLLLFGESDCFFPARRCLERLRQFAPNAETVLLSGTGHVIVNQADRMQKFLPGRSNHTAEAE